MSNNNNDIEQNPNPYISANLKRFQEKKQENQRHRDIQENRIQAETNDVFRRVVALEDKLRKRSILSTLLIFLCIALSVWLIPRHFVRRTIVDLTSPSAMIDMEGARNAYKQGSIILFEGTCDNEQEEYSIPVSISSASTYWIKKGNVHNIVRSDGSLLLSLSCSIPVHGAGGAHCSISEESICSQ